ncbi:doubled CXXCH domain-containing protein [Aliiruegeria lutimaris]|uniref:Doubled CXXCH domain-containing protein n=2 Tax=Aliiruegeria lutimaris TaxID=571298 RepID=A0A1G8UVD2_9RHOB|nr:doubled CXXCH domain-containing protein [Aliiruegeria lutimaris]
MQAQKLPLIAGFAALAMTNLAIAQAEFDPDTALENPKEYVGSDVCRTCHLEHFDSWKRTLHSKMLQDAKANEDVFVTELDEATIRADFAKLEDKLSVPSAEVYVPTKDEVLYTIGSQWKQRYLVKKDGTYFIAPTQFNIDTGRWVNYHEGDWDKRPWLLKCGGCHATGVNLEEESFVEPGVGCESCHGPGSHHAALPSSETFEKRSTIVNPGKLTGGIATQICGSCHNRGTATKHEGAGWPVGYMPGKALESYYASIQPGDKHLYSNEFSKGHHQQYIDWTKSKHADSGIDCISCHVVHELGNPQFEGKTKVQGDQLCLSCHEQVQQVGAHSVHSFGNCVSCHMPRIAKSAESGDIRSHVFDVLLPQATIDEELPNSCQASCHEDDEPAELQKRWDDLTVREAVIPISKVLE